MSTVSGCELEQIMKMKMEDEDKDEHFLAGIITIRKRWNQYKDIRE